MSLLAKANIVFLVVAIAAAGSFYLRPLVAEELWAEEYKDAMFRCDQVMREHLISKMAVEVDVSAYRIKNLQAAEIGLLDCHEYDKLRKKLIAWGNDANDLSRLGLQALEEKAYDLQRFVEIHEIRY